MLKDRTAMVNDGSGAATEALAGERAHTRPGAVRPDHEVLEFTRVFDAPASLVFRMWSEAEHLVRWVGPEGHFLVACEVDFRPGGRWMQTFAKAIDPGYRHTVTGVYREIDAPRRLSMTYVNDYDGVETLVSMDFRGLGDGRTEMVFRQEGFQNLAERDGHGWGWRTGMDLLAAYLLRLDHIEVTPVGRPRRDGVAEDLVAARRRHAEALEKPASRSGRD